MSIFVCASWILMAPTATSLTCISSSSVPPPPASPLFPYTTLFRSRRGGGDAARGAHRFRPGHSESRESADSARDRKSTRLNSSHTVISYAVFCLKKKNVDMDGGYGNIFNVQSTTALYVNACLAAAH